jgi:hypothetical protein
MSQGMKQRMVSSLILAAIFSPPVLAQEPPSSPGSYVVSPGSIGGQPATILLDRATGRTWYLGEVDSQGKFSIALPAASSGKPIWVPISFAPAPQEPRHAEPSGELHEAATASDLFSEIKPLRIDRRLGEESLGVATSFVCSLKARPEVSNPAGRANLYNKLR